MICLRSTTSNACPSLIRAVSRSPNAFAVLLSIRPLTSTTVTSPARLSAISMTRLPKLLHKPHDVVPTHSRITHLVHQCLDEMQPEPSDRARLDRAGRWPARALARIKGLAVVL